MSSNTSSRNLYSSNSSSSSHYSDNITSQQEHNIERRFHTPTYTRKSTRHISQFEPDATALWGWTILIASYFIFVFSMYAIVVSKFVPETGNKVKKSLFF